jgi:hypothetical protein
VVDGPGAVGSPGPSPGQACWEPGPRGRESTLGALLGAPDHRPRKKRHRRWQRYSARLPTAVEPGASPTHPSTSACVTARKPVLSQGHNPDQAASNSPEISCKLHRLPGHVRRTPAVRRAVVPEAADGQSADGSGSLQLSLPFLKAGQRAASGRPQAAVLGRRTPNGGRTHIVSLHAARPHRPLGRTSPTSRSRRPGSTSRFARRVLETCTKTRTGRFRWLVGNSTRPIRCRGPRKDRPAISKWCSAFEGLFSPHPSTPAVPRAVQSTARPRWGHALRAPTSQRRPPCSSSAANSNAGSTAQAVGPHTILDAYLRPGKPPPRRARAQPARRPAPPHRPQVAPHHRGITGRQPTLRFVGLSSPNVAGHLGGWRRPGHTVPGSLRQSKCTSPVRVSVTVLVSGW